MLPEKFLGNYGLVQSLPYSWLFQTIRCGGIIGGSDGRKSYVQNYVVNFDLRNLEDM